MRSGRLREKLGSRIRHSASSQSPKSPRPVLAHPGPFGPHLQVLQAGRRRQAREAEGRVSQAVRAVGQAVQEPGHGGGVVAAWVEAQGAGGRRQQAGRLVVGAGSRAGRGPGRLWRLRLRQGCQAAVRVRCQVGKGGGGVGRLAVGQWRLRVGRREVGRLEVGGGGGGGRVAERRRRPVGRLGQRRQAGPASRCAQPVGALLGKERDALGNPPAAEKTSARKDPPQLEKAQLPSCPRPGARGLPLSDPRARELQAGDSGLLRSPFSAGGVLEAPSLRDFVGGAGSEGPALRLPEPPCPRTRDHSPWRSRCAPAWGGECGARGVAAVEPSPDGERCGKRHGEPVQPRGVTLRRRGATLSGAQRASGLQLWAPPGGPMGA